MLARVNKSYVPAYWDDFFNDSFFNRYNSMNCEQNGPAVNIREDDENYRLEVAVPGMKREDIHIHLEDDLLSISSKETEQKTEEDRKYSRREFGFRSFKRSFRLGDAIDQDSIEANHEAGILSIRLPKKAEALSKAPRQIEIS